MDARKQVFGFKSSLLRSAFPLSSSVFSSFVLVLPFSITVLLSFHSLFKMGFTFVRARPFTRAFTFILLHSGLALAFTQCYYPDGAIPQDYVWEPCTGNTYSSCCVPGEGDVCQPDGLCYYPQTGYLYRGTCTDRTWNDPSCNSDICVDGTCSSFEASSFYSYIMS
jgi:hypothetical protein